MVGKQEPGVTGNKGEDPRHYAQAPHLSRPKARSHSREQHESQSHKSADGLEGRNEIQDHQKKEQGLVKSRLATNAGQKGRVIAGED